MISYATEGGDEVVRVGRCSSRVRRGRRIDGVASSGAAWIASQPAVARK
jgi:hypothetical protein